jgi:hypothetical protein
MRGNAAKPPAHSNSVGTLLAGESEASMQFLHPVQVERRKPPLLRADVSPLQGHCSPFRRWSGTGLIALFGFPCQLGDRRAVHEGGRPRR